MCVRRNVQHRELCGYVLSSHLLFWTSGFYGRTGRGHTRGRSHRISPPSFCGVCLNFSREKDSAVPFPRWPWSRILGANDLIVLVLHYLLGIFLLLFSSSFFFFLWGKIPVRVTTPRFELTSQRQKVSRLPTEPPGGRPAITMSVEKGSFTISWFIISSSAATVLLPIRFFYSRESSIPLWFWVSSQSGGKLSKWLGGNLGCSDKKSLYGI